MQPLTKEIMVLVPHPCSLNMSQVYNCDFWRSLFNKLGMPNVNTEGEEYNFESRDLIMLSLNVFWGGVLARLFDDKHIHEVHEPWAPRPRTEAGSVERSPLTKSQPRKSLGLLCQTGIETPPPPHSAYIGYTLCGCFL